MTALDRLEALQRGFSQVIRTPLERATGTLRAAPEHYDRATLDAVAGDAAHRLAVYNRQYWFRLFGVMQQAYRLATALLGPWEMNGLAARFLTAVPPRGHDLGLAVIGFEAFVATERPAAPILEALRIDDAYRTVFSAPEQPLLRLGPGDAERLPRARLRRSPRCVIVEETRPLVALRRELGTTVADRPHAMPAAYPDGPHAWAICQTAEGSRTVPLARGFAVLVDLLAAHPVREALAILETRVPAGELAVDRWFSEGMKAGFWSALDDDPETFEQPPRQ